MTFHREYSSKAIKARTHDFKSLTVALKYVFYLTLATWLVYSNFTLMQGPHSVVPKLRPSSKPLDKERRGHVSGVQVWEAHTARCAGSFLFRNSTHGAPPLMLREASVDFRHNSIAEFRAKSAHDHKSLPFRRVALQISAAPDGRIPSGMSPVMPPLNISSSRDESNFPQAYLTNSNGAIIRDITVSVDYILRDPQCAEVCFYIDTARTICAGQEWQVILSLKFSKGLHNDRKLQNQLDRLESMSAKLAVSLPIVLPSGKQFMFKPWMTLSCISGLTTSTSLAPLMKHQSSQVSACEKSKGAVQVTGGPVFGHKRETPFGQKEIAHYAARALLGSVRFQTVAVGVVTNRSVSEIAALCEDNVKCAEKAHQENLNNMRSIASVVEAELGEIGVPRHHWSRIVLFPFCRLGTDYTGYEAGGNACRWSAYYGQLVLNSHAYTVFSPFHKWHASVDLDEFFVKETNYLLRGKKPHLKHPSAHPEPAADIFDRRTKHTHVQNVAGALRFRWLDFRLHRPQWINLTRDVMQFGGLEMSSTDGFPLNRTACYGFKRIEGKSAVSCEFGIGVSNHDMLLLKKADSLHSRYCKSRSEHNFDEEIVTYHARHPSPRNGKCLYTGHL